MAKTRKSSVKRQLPDIEQTTKAVEQLTKDVSKTGEQLKKAVADYDKDKYPVIGKKMGRPKSEHGRVRFTTLVEPFQIEMIRAISSITGKEQHDLFNEAIADYLTKLKQQDKETFDLAKKVADKRSDK